MNTVDGGAGADTLRGLDGNDTYVVDESVTGSGGIDTVLSSITFSLADSVHAKGPIENLVLTGTGAINGTGNALANHITGNSAANVLDGGTGADTLVGGLGNDVYVVDNAGDVVSEASALAGEIDTVLSSVTWTLGANQENLVLTGTGVISGTGNALGNDLAGNSAANTLKGLDGIDTLSGGDGWDRLEGGLGNDTLTGGTGSTSPDVFVFNTAIKRTANIDKITDFQRAYDQIFLDDLIFKGLGLGTASGTNIKSTMFVANTSGLATSAAGKAQIVYETDTGKLLYDADGKGGAAAIQFARLGPNLGLRYGDFEII